MSGYTQYQFHRDTPAHRRAVEEVIEKHKLQELTTKVEAHLERIGVRPTFLRHIHAACAAAIKRDVKAHLNNDPDREAYHICDEIWLAAGVPKSRIDALNGLIQRDAERKKVLARYSGRVTTYIYPQQ